MNKQIYLEKLKFIFNKNINQYIKNNDLIHIKDNNQLFKDLMDNDYDKKNLFPYNKIDNNKFNNYYFIYKNWNDYVNFYNIYINKFKNINYVEKIFYKNYNNFKINKEKYLVKEYDNDEKILNEFQIIYKNNKDEIFNNPKIEFRYFCYYYLNYIRQLELPKIEINKNYEAVLIEYRCFPHLEFIIRNAIFKLDLNWSHTIICGNLNYEFILDITKNISDKIKVIKTNYDNLNQSTYSELLSTVNFWNNFNGEKILLYQEDSVIFKSNINKFLKWDYIGAPWPINQDDNPNGVGNGGFSLRSKQCMIDVINKISIKNTNFNNSTLKYMKNSNLSVGPEDVYFSLNMIKYNIGKVADRKSAELFSTESIYNEKSFGGHNFWLNNKDWKNNLYKNIIKQVIPKYEFKSLEHRGGWKSILDSQINNKLYKNNSNVIFFDMIERYFLWNTKYVCSSKWCGVIHCTPKTPNYQKKLNIEFLFNNKNFLLSLKNCLFIISLSKYITNFLKIEFKKLNINIKIFTLKHPVYINQKIPKFSLDNFNNNNDKYLISIGRQLRKVTSIYRLKINNYKNLWLTGTKNINSLNKLFKNEIEYLNLDQSNFNDVIRKYTDTFEEYDDYLSKNIVFIDLFDASANNALLECIIRNTPVIIKKIEAVVEYLGKDYPLYFNNLEEVPELINNKNIENAYYYLENMNKDDISIDYFNKKVFTIINQNL